MSQISYIKYSDVLEAHRYDAEYFKLSDLLNINKIKNNEFGIIATSGAFVTDGEHGSPDWDNNSNIKYITAEKIKDCYIEDGEFQTISETQFQRNIRASVLPKDVLIYSVGVYCGLTAMTEDHMLPASIPRSVAIIRLKGEEKIFPEILTVFLNTKYGKSQTNRLKAGNAQPMLALEQIKKIMYPKFNTDFQIKVKEIYNLANINRQKSKQLYKEAEELLLTELGLLDYQVKHKLIFSATKKEIEEAQRIDSEYFQPKYKEIIKKIEGYGGGWDLVKNQFKQNINISKKDGDYCNYIEISDVNVSNGEIISNRVEINEIPVNGKRRLFKNDLLISKVRPYRGATSFIDFEVDNLIGSGAFTVLQEKTDYKKEVLMIFLKTIFIKELLLRYNCGTSYPVIKDEDILNLKIPLIKPSIQKQIAEKIQESHKLRKESKKLLEEAKRKVEEEIEK